MAAGVAGAAGDCVSISQVWLTEFQRPAHVAGAVLVKKLLRASGPGEVHLLLTQTLQRTEQFHTGEVTAVHQLHYKTWWN